VLPLVGEFAAPLVWGGVGEGAGDLSPRPVVPRVACVLRGGIREEVWLRLGFVTMVAWTLARLTRRQSPGPATLWSGIVLASLLFGAVHLPRPSAWQALQIKGDKSNKNAVTGISISICD
jgi:hypothetical protein